MKKMFFTAIALVAFSATSMANTIEVKEIEISSEEVKASCVDSASWATDVMEMQYHNCTGYCFTTETYTKLYNMNLALCNQ